MALSEPPGASVLCACTRNGLYLAGRPAEVLLALRRLAASVAALVPGPQQHLTLRQCLDTLLPPA